MLNCRVKGIQRSFRGEWSRRNYYNYLGGHLTRFLFSESFAVTFDYLTPDSDIRGCFSEPLLQINVLPGHLG